MNRLPSISALAAAMIALCLSLPASAAGTLTCETPAVVGVTMLASGGGGADGDMTVTRVEESASLGVNASGDPRKNPDTLFTCAVGPLPPRAGLNTVGDLSGQAYVEHGLSEDTRWAGLQFDVAVPELGLSAGTDISVLSVDFDAASGGSEHFLVSVQRAGKRSGAELVVRRGPGAGKEVARLPLADGAVMLTWPGKAAPWAPLVVAAGGRSFTAALAPGSHASAVRIGYLGLDKARQGSDQIYIVDPTFVAR